MTPRLARLIVLAVLMGCRDASPSKPVVIPISKSANPDWNIEWPTPKIVDVPKLLFDTPAEVAIGDSKMRLEVELIRDFFPVGVPDTPIDGRPMCAYFRLMTVDESPFPASIQIEQAWVIFGKKAWEIAFDANTRVSRGVPPSIHFEASGGPKWGPDEQVDVVVKFRDKNGVSILLQAKNQKIKETS